MKKFLIVVIVLVVAFLVIPEQEKLEIAYRAQVEDYNPKMTKFLINTKVGRKISYIFIRKTAKKQLKKAKMEVNKLLKDVEKSFD